MVTVKHDPRRVHPPLALGARGTLADTCQTPAHHFLGDPFSIQDPLLNAPAPREPDAPRTLQSYENEFTSVSIALGESGEHHRIVWVNTNREYRNAGHARAMVEQVIADLDADGRASTVIIRNVDVDCNIPQLQTFFESLGYVVDPDATELVLNRDAVTPA